MERSQRDGPRQGAQQMLFLGRGALDARHLPGLSGLHEAAEVATPSGARALGDLRAGDMVTSASGETAQVLWAWARAIGSAELTILPHLGAIEIFAGALGPGLPERTMLVAPDHMVEVSDPALTARLKQRLGVAHAQVAARHLTHLPGIRQLGAMGYRVIELLLDAPGNLRADGLALAQLSLSQQALARMPREDLGDLLRHAPRARHATMRAAHVSMGIVLNAKEAADMLCETGKRAASKPPRARQPLIEEFSCLPLRGIAIPSAHLPVSGSWSGLPIIS